MRNESGPPGNGEDGKDLSEQEALRLALDMRRQVQKLRDKTRAYRKAITAASTEPTATPSDKDG